MQDFIEKWKIDNIFKTKVKLGVSTFFVVIVSIFAFSTRQPIPVDIVDNDDETTENKELIEIPEEYDYAINIDINEKIYKYRGTKKLEEEYITKTVDGIESKYIYKDNYFYKDSISINNIVDREEVYDIVNSNYLDLETINKYLSISTKEDNKHIVYIKDIILGHDSEEYITIMIDQNKINIDYTSLMILFDKNVESYKLEVIIEEKE